MKRYISYIIIAIVIATASVANANAQSLTEKASAAYSDDKYQDALDLYLQAAESDGISSDLMYNIGNCYYRLGNNGKAILYYERALNIDPANSNARDNLQFVNSKIVDNTNVDETNIIGEIVISIRQWFSSNAWAVISIVLFLLLIAAIVAYIFAESIALRKIGFFGGIILFILTICTNCFAFASYKRICQRRYAIITVPSVTLSTSPRTPKDKSEEAFILNEGTKIYILDSVANRTANGSEMWLDIKADDNHRAWIKKSQVDII